MSERPFLKIGRLIRNLRLSAGLAQHELAERANINNSYLSRIENGERRPSPKIMKKMAEILPTTYEELVLSSGLISDEFTIVPVENSNNVVYRNAEEMLPAVAKLKRRSFPPKDNGERVIGRTYRRPAPVFDRIPAGFFDEANVVLDYDNIEQIVLSEDELGYDPKAFALRVKGDSMVDAGIFEDDIVIVSPNTAVTNGDIAAVSYRNVDITLKKYFQEGTVVVLQPCNSRYPPHTFPDPEEIRVLGKVILVRRKLI